LSTMAYIGASALVFTWAPAACPDEEEGADCAISITDGLHYIGLASAKANLAAGFCGGHMFEIAENF